MRARASLIFFLVVVLFSVMYLTKRKTTPDLPLPITCAKLRAQLESQSCPDTVAFDWGELLHYREENSRLPPPAAGEPRAVFFGDSITLEWPVLSQPKPFAGLSAVNRGISGQLTAQMLLRFRQDVIDLHPVVVVIQGGTNDLARILPPALPSIESNLASMVQLAQANGIRTILAAIPPVNDYELDPQGQPYLQTHTHSPQQIRELNDWLRKYAAETHCSFIDYYSAMVDNQGFLKKGFSADGLHPNAVGYAAMEPLAAEALKAAAH